MPPLEQRVGIVVSALRVATLAVVPVAPIPIEYQRLTEVRQLADDMASFRADNRPVPFAILLTRVVPRAVSTTVYREQAQLDGFLCLQAVVGLARERAGDGALRGTRGATPPPTGFHPYCTCEVPLDLAVLVPQQDQNPSQSRHFRVPGPCVAPQHQTTTAIAGFRSRRG